MQPRREQLISKKTSGSLYDELKPLEEISRIEQGEIEHIAITDIFVYVYLHSGIDFKIRRVYKE